MAYVAVLDACVLFPASLRDTLLRAAQADLFSISLTEEILEEVYRNLIKRTMPSEKALRLINRIRERFHEGFVDHHRPLIPSMSVNDKDRHVLAAAVASRADVIVTQNLKDFPDYLLSPFDVKALSPDHFLTRLFYADSESFLRILIQQAEDLHNPPMAVADILDTLKQHVPVFVDLIRSELGL